GAERGAVAVAGRVQLVHLRLRRRTPPQRILHKLLTQVGLAHEVAPQEIVCQIVKDDISGLDHVAPVGDTKRHAGVLLDEEYRRPLLADIADYLEDRLDLVW